MSGRAGRRGFDSIGNVVFFGVPWKKICQLMTTGVPSLRSSGTLDFSTILRLVTFEMLSPFSEEDQQKVLASWYCGFVTQLLADRDYLF